MQILSSPPVVALQAGKSYTLNEILPHALADCEAPGFGSSSQILMLHVDCEKVMLNRQVRPASLYLTCDCSVSNQKMYELFVQLVICAAPQP